MKTFSSKIRNNHHTNKKEKQNVSTEAFDAWRRIPQILSTLQQQTTTTTTHTLSHTTALFQQGSHNKQSHHDDNNSTDTNSGWSSKAQTVYRETTNAVLLRKRRSNKNKNQTGVAVAAPSGPDTVSVQPPPQEEPKNEKQQPTMAMDGATTTTTQFVSSLVNGAHLTVGTALTAMLLVLVVLHTLANAHAVSNTIQTQQWKLILPWLVAATLVGYELGTRTANGGDLLQVAAQPPTLDREAVIRDVHRRVSVEQQYVRPPLLFPFRDTTNAVVTRSKQGLVSLWKQPLSNIPFLKRQRHGTTLEEPLVQEQQESALVARIPLPLDAVTTLDEFMEPPPLLPTRGMDLFFNGGEPVSNVSQHPALLELRKQAPLVIVNGMTHIANVILYFELPSWVVSWDGMSVDDTNDSPETKILKCFLLGSDAYRGERIVIVPSIVDAPLPVKMMAPRKAEIPCCTSKAAPSCWHLSLSDDTGLQPAIELEMDLISSKMIRNVVGIVSKHLHKISLDVSCVIYNQDKSASVCLSCFCFDHIDMLSCPSFPMNDSSMVCLPE